MARWKRSTARRSAWVRGRLRTKVRGRSGPVEHKMGSQMELGKAHSWGQVRQARVKATVGVKARLRVKSGLFPVQYAVLV